MNHNTRDPANRQLMPSDLTIGLLSRLIPLVFLAVGSLWWMTTANSALGQFQSNPRYGNQAFTQPGFSPLPNQPAASQPAASQPAASQPAASQPAASQPEYQTAAAPTIPSIESPEASTPETEPTESNWWQPPAFVTKIAQGGWLMIPLGVCSLIVLTLSLERLVTLRRGRVIPKPFVRRFTECVEDGQLSHEEATELCEEFDCPVSEVFRAALRRWGHPMLEIEQAVMDAGDRVGERLKRFLRVFHAISNVAPLLGLLGTVLGMIQAFETISSTESIGRPEMLAAGISMALITTAAGLSVAIPAYLAYMYFSSKSDSYLHEIDKLCQRVIDCISAEGLENAGSSRGKKRRAA